MLLNPDSDVFPVFAWFLVDFFIDMSLGRENFHSRNTSADTDNEEDHCRQSSEELWHQVNQQAKTNQDKANCEYTPREPS